MKKFKELCQTTPVIWMGVLNITPNSFSDGGLWLSPEKAVERAHQMVSQGALILDIGGASTNPTHPYVSPEEELRRIKPVLKILREELKDILISVDSYNPETLKILAEENLFDIVNDVYCGRIQKQEGETIWDSFLLAQKFKLGLILMHAQNEQLTMQQNPFYENCIKEVCDFLLKAKDRALSLGIQSIAIDPGIGFGKRIEDNLDLLSPEGLKSLRDIWNVVLIGLSRKWFLRTLFLEGKIDHPSRDLVSKSFEFQAIRSGAKIIRSHSMPHEICLL